VVVEVVETTLLQQTVVTVVPAVRLPDKMAQHLAVLRGVVVEPQVQEVRVETARDRMALLVHPNLAVVVATEATTVVEPEE
jgi:hypothetical protein